ncbi:MAG: hypothetical protein EXS55_01670 [Candidatus Magasanikbacteria bacterium]|nr:hypothetical protein [Candidatus Magasanikbacteria bacterium]
MLEHFFGSRTRFKLLQIFFRSPTKSFYVRELARLAGTQLNGVRRELANLENLGLIAPVEVNDSLPGAGGTERSKYFRVCTDSLLFPELKSLLLKAELLEEREFVELIKKRGGDIALFMLTGIFTQENEIETDILIVGKIKPQSVARIIKDYENELGRTVRYTVMDEKEFQSRREIGDKFLYRIFEARHLNVIDEYGIN